MLDIVRELAEKKVRADARVQALMLANYNQPDDKARIELAASIIEARRERALIEAEIGQYVSHGEISRDA